MIKILEGENTFLSQQRLHFLIEECTNNNLDISTKIIDADNSDITKVINEYETQDMFNPQKLLVIKRLNANKKHKDFVELIFSNKNPSENIKLVIWEDKNIAKNTRYYKLAKKENFLESFPKFNKRSFHKWALEQIDFKIGNDVLQNLIEMTDYDPYSFLNEITKLKLMEKEDIIQEDLEKNIKDIHNNNIWDFIDAINESGERKKQIKILLNLLKNRVDPHYLMIMMARNIKQLLLINKMLSEDKEDKEIVSILKIPPFTLPKLKSIAKKSEYDRLLTLFEKIYNLNYETKIGSIDPELGLILLLTRLN